MAFAMARRGDLPGWLHAVHPVHGVPHRAVVLMGAIGLVIAATGTLEGVAAAASFTILLYYWVANLSAIRMPREAKLVPDAVPTIGLVACTLLAVALPWGTIIVGLSVLAAGFVARMALHRLRRGATHTH
jgi:APA family basic amino acid/polyamine antiporter